MFTMSKNAHRVQVSPKRPCGTTPRPEGVPCKKPNQSPWEKRPLGTRPEKASCRKTKLSPAAGRKGSRQAGELLLHTRAQRPSNDHKTGAAHRHWCTQGSWVQTSTHAPLAAGCLCTVASWMRARTAGGGGRWRWLAGEAGVPGQKGCSGWTQAASTTDARRDEQAA